jgi:N-acetyltransferase
MTFPALTVLENAHVRLEPLDDAHKEDLRNACNADPDIWEIYPFAMNDPHFEAYWINAMAWQHAGERQLYAVMAHGTTVGTTSFYHFPDVPLTCVSIGGTYYAPAVRGTTLNPATKLLLMAHAFASGCPVVQLHVDARNTRSQAAIVKLGAVQTRLIEKDRITWTGHVRDTLEYEIDAAQWPAVKHRLLERLATKNG